MKSAHITVGNSQLPALAFSFSFFAVCLLQKENSGWSKRAHAHAAGRLLLSGSQP